MEAADVGQMVAEMVRVILIACGPVLVVATIVGLLIALGQALTSVQEATLTFVPKLIVVAVSLVVFGAMILGLLGDFMTSIFERIPELVR